MIKSFRHKGIQLFFESGSKSGIQAQHERRLRLQLSRLDDAKVAKDMDAPGWKLHPLKGDLKNHWAIWVDANWRLTFTAKGVDVQRPVRAVAKPGTVGLPAAAGAGASSGFRGFGRRPWPAPARRPPALSRPLPVPAAGLRYAHCARTMCVYSFLPEVPYELDK